jgi:hypothetical protein
MKKYNVFDTNFSMISKFKRQLDMHHVKVLGKKSLE